MKATIAASRVVTPDGVMPRAQVDVEDGCIVSIRPSSHEVSEVTLVPGFVDLQVNGLGPVDVAAADGEDWDALDRLLVASGVTAWCPTLVTAPLEAYAAPLDRIAVAAGRRGARPAILGAHLEGPFLGGAPGAHRQKHIQPLDLDWLTSLPDIVTLVTLAAEIDRVADGIGALVARGVTVSLGHSAATYEEAVAAIDAGALLVTHLFNGMGSLHHRDPGLPGAALTDDRVCVSLIADLVHLHPAAINLAFKAKGPGGVVLVTDAVAVEAADLRELGVTFDGVAPRLPDGTLAGSALTMDQAIRNVVQHAGVGLEDAIAAASATPAALLGVADRGRVAPGCRADLVALDADLRVVATWIGGEQVFAV